MKDELALLYFAEEGMYGLKPITPLDITFRSKLPIEEDALQLSPARRRWSVTRACPEAIFEARSLIVSSGALLAGRLLVSAANPGYLGWGEQRKLSPF